ncbi:MAG TPA: hypothetical protein VMZ33_06225, partial [Candidatus Limnocylindrales bacterium]|nr:hypothetical protein [Candidatus Limnocylindrales bacterium]
AELEQLVSDITPAWHATALAQTLLKLTAPGVPDTYQGTEIWDLSLVDPDNRRAIDWELRRELLDRAVRSTAAEAMADSNSGLPKIWLIKRVLDLRSQQPELFGTVARYQPIAASGVESDRVIAFVRGGEAVTVAPRFNLRGGEWRDTAIELAAGEWRNVLTDETVAGGRVEIGRLLSGFPVAVLVPQVG